MTGTAYNIGKQGERIAYPLAELLTRVALGCYNRN